MENTKKLSPLRKTSTTVKTSIQDIRKESRPPKGAFIVSSDIRTETEEIENGFLITKNYDIRWKKKESDDNSEYSYYSKKWYTKTDPLTVTLNDKSIADAFDDDDDVN